MLIIFNLIYCTYLGREAGEAERGEGSRSPPFASSTPFLLRFVRVCPQRTHHPHPVVVWMWFYFLSVSPPLSHPSAPTSPPPPLSLALSWASVQLNLYTLCTHNQPNENPTANTLSAGWSGSVLRRLGGPGEARAEGPETEGGFSGAPRPLGGSWAGVIVFVMSRCVTNSPPQYLVT